MPRMGYLDGAREICRRQTPRGHTSVDAVVSGNESRLEDGNGHGENKLRTIIEDRSRKRSVGNTTFREDKTAAP